MKKAPAVMADSRTYAENTKVHSFLASQEDDLVLPRFGKGTCTLTMKEYWSQRGGKPERIKGPVPVFWE
jgi:hypothetical protein